MKIIKLTEDQYEQVLWMFRLHGASSGIYADIVEQGKIQDEATGYERGCDETPVVKALKASFSHSELADAAITPTQVNTLFKQQLFPLGQVVSTPGALALIDEHQINGIEFLSRHASGDWGDLDQHDQEENDLSLKEGFRILSSYKTEGGKLWIITEKDRSATTFLLPTEY